MFHVAASNTSTLTTSRPSVWTGRALSGLVILFLVVDAAMKIAALPIVAEAAMTIDWTVDPGFWRAMGLLLLAITALYVPDTQNRTGSTTSSTPRSPRPIRPRDADD
jgi:hypothetical protein